MSTENLSELANKAEEEVVVTPTPEAPLVPVIPQELSELVGEGKKYATVDAALKSIIPAQAHISNLESQLADRKSVSEMVENLRVSPRTETTTPPLGVDPSTIAQVVQNELTKSRQEDTHRANVAKVHSAFKSKYGEKMDEVYSKIAQDSGMSVAALHEITKAAPDMVLKLAGLEKAPAPLGRVESSVNTYGLNANPDPTTGLTSKVENYGSSASVEQAWLNAGKIVKAREESKT